MMENRSWTEGMEERIISIKYKTEQQKGERMIGSARTKDQDSL